MTIWRLVKEQYARVAYDGGGGLVSGGRWHSAGWRACYASEHTALAVLEKLVWTDDDAVHAEVGFVLVPLTLDPEHHLRRLGEGDLPPSWDAPDHAAAGAHAVGDAWLAEESAPVLSVPSVLLAMARNFLVNPLAPEFEAPDRGEPVPFEWDPRLFENPFPASED